MGASHSNTRKVNEEFGTERTLQVSADQLSHICMAMHRAQIEVVATSLPHESSDKAMMWVKSTDAGNALIDSGAMGPSVESHPWTSKGSQIQTIGPQKTALDLVKLCRELKEQGIQVNACSPITKIGGERSVYIK